MPSRDKLLFFPIKKPVILLERISDVWLVSSIVVVALGLRWWSPEMRSDLWYDEAYSIAVATQPIGQVMRLLLTADSSPPLYLLQHVYFFATYAMLPIILVGLVSYSLDHYSFFVPRYFLPFSLGVVILLAFAISRMYTQIAMLCVLLFVSYPFVKAWKHSARPEISYKEIASALPDEARPDLLIVHLSPMSYLSVRRYRRTSNANEKMLWSEATGRVMSFDA